MTLMGLASRNLTDLFTKEWYIYLWPYSSKQRRRHLLFLIRGMLVLLAAHYPSPSESIPGSHIQERVMWRHVVEEHASVLTPKTI